MGHVAEGLGVVHDGRLSPEAGELGEGGLGAGDAALALQGVEERRLLAADVTAGAHVQPHLEAVAGAQDVLAQVPAPRRPPRWPCQMRSADCSVFPPQEDVGDIGLDGVAADDQALDQLVRVSLHEQPVLEGARLHLVGVGDEVLRVRCVIAHGDEAPLPPGGKPAPPLPRRFEPSPLPAPRRASCREAPSQGLVSACASYSPMPSGSSVRADIAG